MDLYPDIHAVLRLRESGQRWVQGCECFCEVCPASERLDTVHGVVGGAAELPCNTSAASPENYPMLVMWFKDNNLNPFYRWIESLFNLLY